MRRGKAVRCSGGRAAISGSTILRQTEVLDRVSGSRATKSTQGVFATQSAIAAALASERAIVPLSPPTLSAKASASI